MIKTVIKTTALLLALVTLFTFTPLSTQAEEETIKINAPIIEITSDKTTYGIYDSAHVTVSVSPHGEYPVEDINIGTSIDGQLVALKGGEFSKKIDILSESEVYEFEVALSSNASGLNIFNKIIMFFRKLFGKGYNTVEIPENNFSDRRTKVSESLDLSFSSITGTVTVNLWYKNEIESTDTDGDGLIDYFEKANGLNPNKTDSDNDCLNDYDEFIIIGTDPLKTDTDGNGINDFDDDNDTDGLSNGYEIEIGTSAISSDTDADGLNDKDELKTYYTNPLEEDTDIDGASDGWEVANGFDAKRNNSSFNTEAECTYDNIVAKVKLSANGKVAESIKVDPAKETVLIDSSIPGYLGHAFEFTAEGEFEKAELSFEFDSALLDDPDFVPAIYYLNEETKTFDELETLVDDNVATAWTNHFSTYILLNKTLYVDSTKASGKIDFSLDNGTDSNNDGISDYITKLMCEGVIRTGTGTLVFNDLSYEEVQSSNDFDNDGIINGEEISQTQSVSVPSDAVEYNGHYYKYYDLGLSWENSKKYCENIGGHLITIGTLEENSFAFSLIEKGQKNFYWLGASDALKENDWHWVTDEVWIYTGWSGYFDNNYSGGENYAALLRVNKWGKPGQWNDFTNTGSSDGVGDFGLICEWGDFSVSGKYYFTLLSSPTSNDTDRDGFEDALDPTPNKADVFASMKDYKKYYFDDKTTLTFFSKQPVWDSRTCYSFSVDTTTGYYASGGSGHAFLGIDYQDETKKYFGFGGNTDGFLSSGYPLTAITRKKVPGVWYNELASFSFSVGKTFIIDDSDIDSIEKFLTDHKNDKYQISHNNCTTMAVNILKLCDIAPKIYEHKWTAANVLGVATWSYYGYSPADACQDIKENYDSYICYKVYELTDGTLHFGIEVIGNPQT